MNCAVFQERRFHRRALRVYGDAKVVARANGERPPITAPSTLASALEHKGEQRELSGATRRGSACIHAKAASRVRALIDHYMGNAKILREAVAEARHESFGGVNAPYIWVKTPDGLTSWQMFDRMLRDLNVVITPGSGFGAQGEGYFRISAFNSRENAEEVARRLERLALTSNVP